MAWWDYGYQINGVANRTTVADGNTWNHEHIALLGKCLSSAENVSHPITRHLADYVLIWTTRYAGMYSDDLAKSPHMARIGASVYGDRIGCAAADFYMDNKGHPSVPVVGLQPRTSLGPSSLPLVASLTQQSLVRTPQ